MQTESSSTLPTTFKQRLEEDYTHSSDSGWVRESAAQNAEVFAQAIDLTRTVRAGSKSVIVYFDSGKDYSTDKS